MFYRQLRLPDYNTARGGIYASLTRPPFDFDGTMMRIFPLRARLERVQSFIDAHLNMVPQEGAHFRAYLPYVFLVFMHYGKLSLDAANLGWISQYEVLFGVPVLWYQRQGGRLVFKDFASVSPFIYVDNDHSMSTGREAYGWPKDRFTADSFPTAWMTSPEASPIVARFSAMTFHELYAGMRQTPQPLLEIRQSVGSTFVRFPPDPRASWLPWTSLQRGVTGSADMMRDFPEILRGLGLLREQDGAGPDTYMRMAARAQRATRPYSSELAFNTINLKQFRDAEDPTLAAYQAITNAPMTWRRIRRGGLLGDTHVLQGDLSGGFTIEMYRWPTAPVAEMLGLEVTEERALGGVTVQRLSPVFPMWLDVDMRYSLGTTLAWRAKGQGWHDGEGRPLGPQSGEVTHAPYNTARGAADTQITGPFEFPNATLRVMPLLADKAKLDTFLEEYLGAPLKSENIKVLSWGSYVYLVAANYEDMSSTTNDIGWWADRDLAFYVPARLEKEGKLWKVVLVPAFAYSNSVTAAQTGAEVSGIPMVKATLSDPSTTWMHTQSASAPRTLLSVSTSLLAAVGTGQKIDERVLIDIFEGDPIPSGEEERWRQVAQDWGMTLKEELWRKRRLAPEEKALFVDAHAFALQVLIRRRPIRVLTLKQFRDAAQPTQACYQAVVEIDREITSVREISEIETGLYVRIHHYPTQPIVERLGLVPMVTEAAQGGVLTHVLEPLRPFWLKVSLKEHLGRNLLVRAGSEAWRPPTESNRSAPAPQPVGKDFVRQLYYSDWEPRRLAALFREFSSEEREEEKSIEKVVGNMGPQEIIEGILTEEWERWDGCHWSRKLPELLHGINDARRGKLPVNAAEDEFKYLWELLIEKKGDQRELDLGVEDENLLPLLVELLGGRLQTFIYLRRILLGSEFKESDAAIDQVFETFKRCLERVKDYRLEGPRQKDEEFREGQIQIFETVVRALVGQEERHHGILLDAVYSQERETEKLQRQLAMKAAKFFTRPHHLIRRRTIANQVERERVFPMSESWDEDWFDGMG